MRVRGSRVSCRSWPGIRHVVLGPIVLILGCAATPAKEDRAADFPLLDLSLSTSAYKLTSEIQLSAPRQQGSESKLEQIESNFRDGAWVEFPSERSGMRQVLIRCRQFLSKGNPGDAIVISSGRTESFVKYAELIYDLNANGYSVHICDHRGQGLSSRLLVDSQKGHVESFDDYVADLKQFVDRYVLPRRYQNLYLIGHSMGGAVASLYIERFPVDFKAAVLASPMHEPVLGGPKLSKPICAFSYLTRYLGGRSRYAAGTGGYVEVAEGGNELTSSPVRYQSMLATYRNYSDARLGGPTPVWVNEACKASDRTILGADRIQIPVLLLQAGDDTAVLGRGQLEFCNRVNTLAKAQGSGRCYGFTVRGARHEIFSERDLYRTPALVKALDFLRSNR